MSKQCCSPNGLAPNVRAWTGLFTRWLGHEPGADRPRILLAESGEHVAELLSSWLERAGYCPRIASDYFTAYNQFRKERPDLLVVDANPGRLPSLAFIRRWKTEAPDMPLLAISGGSSREATNLARAGADGILVKPLNCRGLLSQVEQTLSRYPRRKGAEYPAVLHRPPPAA
ncbi:MAG: response regulator transcription factor [Chloroflexota bacterium]